MKFTLPVLLKDGYKVGHKFQYPPKTRRVYSNITARSSRVPGVDYVIVFGVQAFVQKYLIGEFREHFFELPRDVVMHMYRRRIDTYLGPGTDTSHIGELHELGYLPLEVKSLPEGMRCPLRVPFLTIKNTDDKFYWLTNMVETLMSNILWQPVTTATTAFGYRKRFELAAIETGGDKSMVPWQGHDFSMRGMSGVEASQFSGAAHLLSFTGTDTIPAIDFLEQYYYADAEKELIGGSVPATEHSVMCAGTQESETETFLRLLTDVYPTGIVSVVSDTWDFWKVMTDTLPSLKDVIMARDGKLVIRPDSGDPVKIICGDPDGLTVAQQKGAVRLLWETFGGTLTPELAYRQLDSHVGLIYGDSITPERQVQILARLKANGFCSTNVVLGIGSYTYQYVTRDTFGQAMKATYVDIDGDGRNISKAPKTDDGTKNSACGLLQVYRGPWDNVLVKECCTELEEMEGLLKRRFHNGRAFNEESLKLIRLRVNIELHNQMAREAAKRDCGMVGV